MRKLLMEAVGFGCVLPAVVGPLAILGWQVFTWLKFGFWPPLPLSAVAGMPPQMEWIGLQKVIEDVYEIPLSLVVFFTFIAASRWLASLDKPQMRT